MVSACASSTKKYYASEFVDPGANAALTFEGPYWHLFDNKLLGVFADSFGKSQTGAVNGLMHVDVRNNLKRSQRIVFSCNLSVIGKENVKVVELMPGESQRVTLWPTIDRKKFYNLRSSLNVTATFKMTPEETGDTYSETLDLSVGPLTRFHWFAREKQSQKVTDLRPFIYRFVTPDDNEGEVQSLVSEAAAFTKGQHFSKTNDPAQVWEQMEAIYLALQKRGYVYNHLAARFFDGAQRVRLPSESLKQNHGNCIDTSLVFASAFEAIGLNAFLIFSETHAQVGVRYPDSKKILVLETTDMQSSSFAEAIKSGGHSQTAYKDDPHYAHIYARDARQIGIFPLAH